MVGAPEVPPEECRFLRILKLSEVKISAPLTSLVLNRAINVLHSDIDVYSAPYMLSIINMFGNDNFSIFYCSYNMFAQSHHSNMQY